ncbi:MAG: PrsW family intramembrane metalloprotease [Brooklawnia sp.]|uniref:PrsW family intramembrane metalloprotease n=1 Tax=Brooklawnia sp. TaxID=2699740 RepID=UPI003C77EC51
MSADADVWRPPAATAPVRATGLGAAAHITKASNGVRDAGVEPAAQYRLARNGLAVRKDASLGWWRRNLVRNPYAWLTAGLTIVYAVLLFSVYQTIGNGLIEEVAAVTEEAYGQPTILTWPQINEAYLLVARMAGITLGVYLLILLFIDRLRPTTWTMKWLALGWGAAASVFISLHVNTWAGELMRAEGPVDPAQGARSAIFSAPFVEEAAKATVLFGLAILMRRRIVGVHQVLTLSSLSALGFAFTENIVYYLRVYLYSVTIYQTEAEAELAEVVFMRGVATSFGHPLFTALIALGLIVALVNRSKLVRVLAPVAGYLAAAFGHMLFNGIASVSNDTMILIVGGWIAVAVLVIYTIFRYVHQVRNIKARLAEYVQLGWLQESDPHEFSRIFGRWRMALSAFLRGPRVFRATLRLQRILTELAYLREQELRGIVDAMAIERQRELILAAGEARAWAIDHTAGVRFIPPEWGERWRAFTQHLRDARAQRRARQQPAPQWAPPTGAPVGAGTGSWPSPTR